MRFKRHTTHESLTAGEERFFCSLFGRAGVRPKMGLRTEPSHVFLLALPSVGSETGPGGIEAQRPFRREPMSINEAREG